MTDADRCELCGNAVDTRDRHVRFALPDPVLTAGDIPASDIWMTDDDARSSDMMQVNGVGAFVRALLRVTSRADGTVTYGVWVGVHPDDLRRFFDTWWSPEYRDLEAEGYLANAIEPWGLLGAPVRLRVLDPQHAPYCVATSDPVLQSVLADASEHVPIVSDGSPHDCSAGGHTHR